MEEIVTEKSNLLLDYVGKFINQMSGNANPAVKLTKSQSIISNDGLRGCEMPIDVEECIPFINYLDKKHHQLYGLSRVFDLITNFFTKSFKKCDSVMNKKKCQTAIVSQNKRLISTTPNFFERKFSLEARRMEGNQIEFIAWDVCLFSDEAVSNQDKGVREPFTAFGEWVPEAGEGIWFWKCRKVLENWQKNWKL